MRTHPEAQAVEAALRAIADALEAIGVVLADTRPPRTSCPVDALAEALAGAGGDAPPGVAAAMRDLADQAAAAQRVRERTGIDLHTWQPDAGRRCQ